MPSKTKRSENEEPQVVVYHHHHFYHSTKNETAMPMPFGEPLPKKTKADPTRSSQQEPTSSMSSGQQEPTSGSTSTAHLNKKEWLAQRKKEIYDSYKSGQMFGKK